MKIAVVLRLMPNIRGELELDSAGSDIDRDAYEMVLNEYDNYALEEAVLLKEASGATVTAVGLRQPGLEQALRLALARGADAACTIDAGEVHAHDTRAQALAVAQGLRELAPDLVLAGVETPYDVFGQAAPVISAALGWPQASVVRGVRLSPDAAWVLQEHAGGRVAELALRLPAVVGVQVSSSPPRYVSMGRLRAALGAPIETLVVSPPATSATKIVSLVRTERGTGATMLNGGPAEVAAQIVGLLRARSVWSG